MNKKISVIIVHYNVKKELLDCIGSIYRSKPKVDFEIIVVDNDEVKIIEKDLRKKFPKIIYIKNRNNGWGGGVNKGVKYAKGDYLYFLNPDTIFINNALDTIYDFAKSKKNVGIASSLLFDEEKNVYPLQGTKLLNPLNAIFSLSFINKFYPNNPISKKFWMKGRSKKDILEVESSTLSAALIKKEIFTEAGKFDENYFLYYEEYDLSKRIKRLGYKNFIVSSSKVIHIWEASAIKTGRTKEFMDNSRKYYFKKYYGSIISSLIELVLGLNRTKLLLYLLALGIFSVGIYLRLDALYKYVTFIGDQAWFYLSARDFILTGEIPLLGITSSHTWIHQGPLWTYLLTPALFLSSYNPISGFYLSALLGVLILIASYKFGKDIFSRKFGLIFSSLLAVSPLVVFHSRFAYHTTPIPLFMILLFYSMSKWIKGNANFFPAVLFSMSVLYNLELATVIFWPVIILYLIYGFVKKKVFALDLLKKSIVLCSLLALIIPMVPILIYDVQNGFPQTIVFMGWFGYKLMQFVGIIDKSAIDESSFSAALNFFVEKYSQLVFVFNKYTSFGVFLLTILVSLIVVLKKSLASSFGIVFVLTLTGLLAYFASGVPSEAYLVMLFPGLLFALAYAIYQLRNIVLIIVVVAIISVINIYHLKTTNYLTKNTITLSEKISASKEILNLTNSNELNLIYNGPGEEFESSRMPYEYLVWWRSGMNLSETGRKVLVIEHEGNIIISSINE